MTANKWILALHLIGLFFWVGYLLTFPRLLAVAAALPDEPRKQLALRLRRGWMTVSPLGLLVLVTGLMMLHGVASPAFASVGEALSYHFKPTNAGVPGFWYVTFHVKLVSFTLLSLLDFWLGSQARRMAAGAVPRVWPLAVPLALSAALLCHVTVWLTFSEIGLIPAARFMGYGAALIGGTGAVLAARKLGRGDAAGKYHMVHGVIAALVVLIVILVIAKPLAFGGSTLG